MLQRKYNEDILQELKIQSSSNFYKITEVNEITRKNLIASLLRV
jgi:hypothetical protein